MVSVELIEKMDRLRKLESDVKKGISELQEYHEFIQVVILECEYEMSES